MNPFLPRDPSPMEVLIRLLTLPSYSVPFLALCKGCKKNALPREPCTLLSILAT
jgi:hypothetical protein